MLVFDQIGKIGYDEVDAGHLLGGEDCARIYDYNVVPALQGGHVFAYFAYAAEEYDLDGALFGATLFLGLFGLRPFGYALLRLRRRQYRHCRHTHGGAAGGRYLLIFGRGLALFFLTALLLGIFRGLFALFPARLAHFFV